MERADSPLDLRDDDANLACDIFPADADADENPVLLDWLIMALIPSPLDLLVPLLENFGDLVGDAELAPPLLPLPLLILPYVTGLGLGEPEEEVK